MSVVPPFSPSSSSSTITAATTATATTTTTAPIPPQLLPSHPPSSRPKRTPVPFLLEAFPTPPTHIPPSPQPPSSPFNPPPSLPPTSPLPPVPGPSPISDRDAYLFIASRRSSKMSLASTHASTDAPHSPLSRHSSATTLSSAGVPPPAGSASPSASATAARPRRGSLTSIRSAQSTPNMEFPLSASRPSYIRSLSTDKPAPITDSISEEDPADVVHPPPGDELSIAAIDIRDIHAQSDHDEPHPDAFAHAVHLAARSARSKSEAHKKLLLARSESPSAAQHCLLAPASRSASPDVTEIISATPRPRRTPSSQFSRRSSSRSLSRSAHRHPRRELSGYGAKLMARRDSEISAVSLSSDKACFVDDPSEKWADESFVSDYGVPIESSRFAKSPASFDTPDAEDSDSSIDIHTPLPHLMLRDGLLSPNSKLLPVAANSPPLPNERPASVYSVASSNNSLMTKSGIYKDQRDTPGRRHRHRDGKLLKGGIGLTTGLGWSDSEDEGAPSPFTRRLSSLSSKRSPTSHSLARSYSSSILHSVDESTDTLSNTMSIRPRASLPPSSWQKRTTDNRVSVSSTASLAHLSVSEQEALSTYSLTPTQGAFFADQIKEPIEIRTPSSSSSLSLPLPATPDNMDPFPSLPKFNKDKVLPPIPSSTPRNYSSHLSFQSNFRSHPGLSQSRPRTHSSASSVSSAGAPSNNPLSSRKLSIIPTPGIHTTPRPLHLGHPQPSPISPPLTLQPGEQAPRAGKILTYNRNIHDQQRMRSASGPSRPPAAAASPLSSTDVVGTLSQQSNAKPKPRTGTGMVYRSSSNPAGSASKLRLPSTTFPSAIAGSGSRSSSSRVVSLIPSSPAAVS